MSRRLAALVLAAGGSSRLGHPKQLVEFQGERLLDRAIRIAHQAGASPVFVVLGAECEQMLAALEANAYQPRILINKAWTSGMASSLRLGAAAAERDGVDNLLVLACDQPSVTADHLLRLVEVSKREHVVASHYRSRRGIPALFPDFAFHALQDLTGDTGARDLLQDDAVLTVVLPVGEFDIDTHEDLLRLQAWDRQGGPSGNKQVSA
ncbi:MAG: nucleotidyltransferase family protein [Janthinobacterium lividum]